MNYYVANKKGFPIEYFETLTGCTGQIMISFD